MWDLTVSVPDHCLSVYTVYQNQSAYLFITLFLLSIKFAHVKIFVTFSQELGGIQS